MLSSSFCTKENEFCIVKLCLNHTFANTFNKLYFNLLSSKTTRPEHKNLLVTTGNIFKPDNNIYFVVDLY